MTKFVTEEPSVASKVSDHLRGAGAVIREGVETGLEPGHPLVVVSNAVRQAPLAALGTAFLLGVMFARPR
jgi:hypothetical protein